MVVGLPLMYPMELQYLQRGPVPLINEVHSFYQERVVLHTTWHSCTALPLIYACNVEVLNLVLIVKVKNIGR